MFLIVTALVVAIIVTVVVIVWDQGCTEAVQNWNPFFLRNQLAVQKTIAKERGVENDRLRRQRDDREVSYSRQTQYNLDKLTEKNLRIAQLEGQISELHKRTSADERTITRLGAYIDGREVLINNLIAAESSARDEIAAKDELLKLAQPKVAKTKKGKKS